MKKSLFYPCFMMIFFMFMPIFSYASGQTESNQYKIKHVQTIEVKYSYNYYSYNFAVYPTQHTIDQIKIKIISDMEQKIIETERDILPPYWSSFGTMIHASNPDNIRYEILEIKVK